MSREPEQKIVEQNVEADALESVELHPLSEQQAQTQDREVEIELTSSGISELPGVERKTEESISTEDARTLEAKAFERVKVQPQATGSTTRTPRNKNAAQESNTVLDKLINWLAEQLQKLDKELFGPIMRLPQKINLIKVIIAKRRGDIEEEEVVEVAENESWATFRKRK